MVKLIWFKGCTVIKDDSKLVQMEFCWFFSFSLHHSLVSRFWGSVGSSKGTQWPQNILIVVNYVNKHQKQETV